MADLVLTKHVDRTVARLGQPLSYTLTVTNKGPNPATHVRLTDTPKLPVRLLSVRPSQGHCETGPPLTCTLGTLPPGAHITIRITAAPTLAGTQTNAAAVMSANKDPAPHNNLAHASTTITGPHHPPHPAPPPHHPPRPPHHPSPAPPFTG